MKNFFSRYSYDSMRMFLDQFAISLFGWALALPAMNAENNFYLLIVSLCAILFYLFLIYDTARRVGDRDRTSINLGRMKLSPFKGALISLLANSLNLLLASVVVLLTILPRTDASMVRFIALFLNGMYCGVYMLVKVGAEAVALHNCWWAYFILPLPAILISTLGYIAGAKDWHLTGLSTPELPASDRPTRKELRERREEEKKKQEPKD